MYETQRNLFCGYQLADRWQIFKPDGSSIGPLSPLEVRDALRDGSIDPFDLVRRVGSKVKQPLVEVDEIFLSADDAEKGKVDSVYDQEGDLASGVGGETVSADIKKVMGAAAPQPVIRQTQPNSRMIEYQPEKPRPQAVKRHAKKYFIVDKRKRFHGPLSAPEIQSLFFRGLVQAQAVVSKNRNGPKVPVQQFVSAYMGARAKKFNSEPTKFNFEAIADRKGLPSSREMEQRARTLAHQAYLAPAGFPYMTTVFVMLALAALLLIVQFGFVPRMKNLAKPGAPVTQRELYDSMDVHPTTDLNAAKPQPSPSVTPPQDAPKPLKIKPQPKTRPAPKARLPRRLPTPRERPRPAVSTPTVAPIVPKPQPAGYAAMGGQTITVSATYAPAALASCGLKCTLAIRDSAGLALSVVFFKAQYEDALKQKAGRASFVGRIEVQGGQNILYLQGIR